MQDLQLTPAVVNFPAAGVTVNTQAVDLGPDGNYSNAWRLGQVVISVPALPNNTDNTKSYTFTIQDAANVSQGIPLGSGSPPALGAFANTNPLIQGSVVGVASTGSLATTLRLPLPPGGPPTIANASAVKGLRGPFRIACAASSGIGDSTALTFTVSWAFE